MTTPTGIEIIGYVIVSNIDSWLDWDDELHPSIEAAIDSLTGTYSPLCRSEEDRTKTKKPWWEEYEIHPVLKAIERTHP